MSHMVLREHPWSSIKYVAPFRSGQTVEEALRSVARMSPDESLAPLVVRVGGYEVPPALWGKLRPKEGVAITVVPDEVAGDSAKQILGAIALIALSVFTAGVASGAYLAGVSVAGMSGAVLAAAIGIVGTLAITALTKPPAPEAFGEMGGKWNQLTGTANQLSPWGSIPVVIGESRYFPPHAAMPFTQSVGQNSYQICMFDLGHGDIEVADIRIGESPLSTFEEVQHEITRTPTLYTDDVSEELVNAELKEFDVVTRTTAPGVEEISLDIVFPAGLFWRGTKPPDASLRVNFEFHYRPVGTTTWLLPANARMSGIRPGIPWNVEANTRTPFAASVRWGVPAGQYEVRVRRLAKTHPDDNRNTYVETATWTVLRSVRHTNPSSTGTNKLVLRIRANDQVTGTLQTLSCLVRQKVRVYHRNTGTWSAPVATTNPAWVSWWLMTECPALSTHVPPTRMDLEGFADYAEFCTNNDLHCRMVLDSQMNARDLLQKVLSGSLGRLSTRDGRYSVVYDHGDPSATMTFTPLEADNFRVSRMFVELPHALRVQFRNVEADYQEDEIIVVADGHSYRGLDARGNPTSAPPAETFETLRVEQAMGSKQAWQLARFHMAQALYRNTTYTWDSDISGLGTTVGDVVDVSHDVPEWGRGWGRVVSIVGGVAPGAPGVATLKLDREVETEPGVSYGIQFRGETGDRVVVNCTPHAPKTGTFYLADDPAGIRQGDTAIIGERGQETAKLIITDVRYGQDLSCSFTAVNYDPRVIPYWDNPPDSIVSEITGRDYGTPEPPIIISVISAPSGDRQDDAGIAEPEIRMGIQGPDIYYLQAR